MSEQDIHVQRLFKILELMGEPYTGWSRKMRHVTFGKIQGMSTRKGTVKFLGEVLDDTGHAMHDVMRGNPVKYNRYPCKDLLQYTGLRALTTSQGMSSIIVQDFSGKR